MKLYFIATRLWRYLNIYFLKPFDAVNDTLTSYLIFEKIKIKNNFLEIGSGDGMFSFIMCGGKFSIKFDRYLDIDLKKDDIFDTHKKLIKFNYNFKKMIRPSISVDAKLNHIKKIRQIGFSKKIYHTSYEKLPFKNNSINYIFFYTAHGMKSLDKSVSSAYKILKKKGNLVILVFDNYVKNHFICHNLKKKGIFPKVFQKFDNGRFKEISKYSKSIIDWENFFKKKGFSIVKRTEGLSGIAWKFYDVQTRPILKYLIIFFNFLPNNLRVLFKFIWMISIYPFLFLFFILFSNIFFNSSKNCYHVFELKK